MGCGASKKTKVVETNKTTKQPTESVPQPKKLDLEVTSCKEEPSSGNAASPKQQPPLGPLKLPAGKTASTENADNAPSSPKTKNTTQEKVRTLEDEIRETDQARGISAPLRREHEDEVALPNAVSPRSEPKWRHQGSVPKLPDIARPVVFEVEIVERKRRPRRAVQKRLEEAQTQKYISAATVQRKLAAADERRTAAQGERVQKARLTSEAMKRRRERALEARKTAELKKLMAAKLNQTPAQEEERIKFEEELQRRTEFSKLVREEAEENENKENERSNSLSNLPPL